MQGFVEQTLNGLTFAGLLFLLGSGFTLIFGLMRVVNLAHGGTYLVGGYVGYSAIAFTHNFVIGMAAAGFAMAIFGIALERGLLVHVRGLPFAELLLTLGVALIMGDMALAIWGGDPLSIHMPGVLGSSSPLGPLTYPNSRLFVLGVAVLVAILLAYLVERTRIGAVIRAGVDDREMVSALGININRVFTLVFILGTFLAGIAGVLGGSLLTLYPGGDSDILLFALVVVIIGGLGSLKGTIAGALVAGLLDNYGQAYFPELAYFTLFAPMVLILLWRPQGLFGRSAF
ncbi:MAG: branched-chain amino acid ABC transporter permease [Candidatus Dormibacteraeota bacterium]|nr:branched-chain amino acid ABC transporter permease [Candidatus Dormibacteraeota bacterium]MBO0759902.1 branched-chain amino acid ABC transporter permease [Candidatus Dormibacteraeota bacterium]